MEIKILIVDDEEIIRDGICKKIERLMPDALVVAKAKNAKEALEIVKSNHPNIIITDIRMPGIDGLQFISMAHNLYKDIKYIIISGYQDFEYARNAIRLGVKDYLVKPIENEQLKDILEKLEKEISEETLQETAISQLKSKANYSIDIIKNKYLTDLTNHSNEFDISQIVKNLEFIDIEFTKRYYTVINILVSELDASSSFSASDFPLLKFSIRNISQEILAVTGTALVFEHFKNDRQVVVILNHDIDLEADSISGLPKICDNLIYFSKKYLKISLTIGIGGTYENISKLPTSYMESYTACMQRIVLGNNKVIHYCDIPDSNLINFFLSDESKLMLTSYIKDANHKQANIIIDKALSKVNDSNLPYSNIKLLYIDLMLLFNRTVKEAGGSWEKIFIQDIFSDDFLLNYTSLSQLQEWLKNSIVIICEYITSLTKSHGKKVIDEVSDFIDNYYYTQINLSDLANKYYLNPNYLGQLFKNETGENFTDFLSNVRLEKAKNLLLNTELKAYKIAEMVGYNNPRYFGEVFQKNTGLTPTEFRKSS